MPSAPWRASRVLSWLALALALFVPPFVVSLEGVCLAQVSFRLDDMQGDAERLEQALQRRGSIDAVQMPLRDFVDRLSQQFGVPIDLSPKKLEEAGVNLDSPITTRLEAVPLGAILNHVLDELELSFTIRHNLIVVRTPEDAESTLTTRIYPVRDLVAYSTAADKHGYEEDYDSLIELITTTIAPQSWDEVGGPGAIMEFPNSSALVISQTDEVHRAIDPLLERLRQVKALQGLPSAALPQPVGGRTLSAGPPRRIAGRPHLSAPARMAAAGPATWQLPQVHENE
jgi:hypothetical protein